MGCNTSSPPRPSYNKQSGKTLGKAAQPQAESFNDEPGESGKTPFPDVQSKVINRDEDTPQNNEICSNTPMERSDKRLSETLTQVDNREYEIGTSTHSFCGDESSQIKSDQGNTDFLLDECHNNEHFGEKSVAPVESSSAGTNSEELQTKIKDETASIEDTTAYDEQERFNTAMKCACELSSPDSVLEYATAKVSSLSLHYALPPTIPLRTLLNKLPNLQEVDISGNNLGPPGFRAVILGLCDNNTITSLNISNNMADTDSSECIGKMLSTNRCLEMLDVSGNHLGKDYFSRCVGPALSSNTSLQVLRCESIGATDLFVLTENCVNNTSLLELNISHNDLLNSKQLVQNLSNWLQFDGCALSMLTLKSCSLKDSDLSLLAASVKSNSSLSALNVSSNKTEDTTRLLDLLVSILSHPNMSTFTADDISFETSTKTYTSEKGQTITESRLSSLSLSGCQIGDGHIEGLHKILAHGSLSSLSDLNLSKNPDLTLNSLSAFVDWTIGGSTSNLKRLSWSLNCAEGIAEFLDSRKSVLELDYLNIRRAKVSPVEVEKLSCVISKTNTYGGGIEALVLDGIKLSGCSVLSQILNPRIDFSLMALSLSGCLLTDEDIAPIASAVKQNLRLSMLKLSANRLTDAAIDCLVNSLLTLKEHSLQLIDFTNNKIGSAGARKLCDLFTSDCHQTKIHSLNLNNNTIGPDGVSSLVSLVHRTCLTSLQVSGQQCPYEEEDMDGIFVSLINALGYGVNEKMETEETFNLPVYQSSIMVKLTGLGGNAGDFGRKIDCAAFPTDLRDKKLPYLSFQDALAIASAFKYQDVETCGCVLSQKEWNMVTSANKECPSWLQLQDKRDSCIYLSHLPASVSVQKMEAVLEMDADCIVQEIFLLKDPVFRKNTGFAWALLADSDNVRKATQFMNNCQAQVYSKAFMVSEVRVKVADEYSASHEASVRQDLKKRLEERRAEEAKHRSLIRRSYAESQSRHAYRLAHPAYADGRIW